MVVCKKFFGTKKMKPIEIFEYKQKWLPGNTVDIHSDLRWDTVPWCRKNFESHKWDYKKYTDNYTDTFYFEDSTDRDKFLETFDYETERLIK